MEPLTNRVLVEVAPPSDKTASGLLIQEDWKTLPPEGTILAIGPDVTLVRVGDRIIFERYSSIILKEKNHRMCQESHILARITNGS